MVLTNLWESSVFMPTKKEKHRDDPLPTLHRWTPAFLLPGKKFLGRVARDRVAGVLELEPGALVTEHRGPKVCVSLYLRNEDTMLMAGRHFRLTNFMPKSYVKQERLGGEGCPDEWADLEGRKHVFQGHRCFSLLPSVQPPGPAVNIQANGDSNHAIQQ
jgi:hypothetical protein